MWFCFNLCFYFSLAKNRYLAGKYWCLCISTLSLPLEHTIFTTYPSVSALIGYVGIYIQQQSPPSAIIDVLQHICMSF